MLQSHASFHSTHGKRRILVVDDEKINRDLLDAMLEEEYELIFAVDGLDAIQKIKENGKLLSLILLDLIMPNMTGQEVLREIKDDPEMKDIPVIVVTSDESQEVECLDAGAVDFIRKPYPNAGVVHARIRRVIELHEDRQTIQSTERDSLTGLYNREFFYSYAEQYDRFHPDESMDAIVLDINHFSIINERYGRAYGDDVLRRVGEHTRSLVHDSGGIVCRCEGDIFFIYCPHREDYKAFMDSASRGISGEHNASAVRLRMGVYSNVDKTQSIERRFDRAKMACDSVRSSYNRNIGIYDNSLRTSELYAAQLIEDFPKGLEERQFLVFFQPKYSIQPEQPQLDSAEALVRWNHPELGMISPGIFIPLFEENGLIQDLDKYVWEEAARQIREWKDTYGFSIPVSVNMSRIDMYDPNIIYTLMSILERYNLKTDDLHLEVTETAYSEDSDQIIEAVKRLRSIGFAIEMDDFGTGYSSLNMLNTLPIDALKLDMIFIRAAFAEETNTQLLEIMIEIARTLEVPVIAEGVEDEEQLRALRDIGCDLAQGYYFSPPVPPEKFVPFLEEAKRKNEIPESSDDEFGASVLTQMKKNSDTTKRSKESLAIRLGQRFNIPLRNASILFVMTAFIIAVALFMSNFLVIKGFQETDKASDNYILAQQSTMELEIASDYLTEQARLFVITGDIEFLQNYYQELDKTKRRDNAVKDLETLMSGRDNAAYEHLSAALRLSDELVDYEYHAMKLVLETGDYDPSDIPEVLKDYRLSQREEALSDEQKLAEAKDLVLDPEYNEYKSNIKGSTAACGKYLITASSQERVQADKHLKHLLILQFVLIMVLLCVVVAVVLFIAIWVRRPLSRMVELMKAKETVIPYGAEELCFVSETYNHIFEENRKTNDRLTYGNMHDALTGLYNRNAYDLLREDIDMSSNALLLVDVDKFKTINDTYGHDVGDQILKRVAEVLEYSFRKSDLIFRLGGDEFVVIMTDVNSSLSKRVESIIGQANVMLQRPVDDLPPASLSVGVAFPDRKNPEGDIFQDADSALYRMKQSGRCGCCIY